MKKRLRLVGLFLLVLCFLLVIASCDTHENVTEEQSIQSEAEGSSEQTQEETTSDTDTGSETVSETGSETESETGSETVPPHDWADATCLIPKTCTVCGETEGEALGHQGGEATCKKKATCELCGEVYGKKADHVFDAKATEPENIYTSATITKPAIYFYSCIWCGTNSTKIFPYGEALGAKFDGPRDAIKTGDVDGDLYLYFTDAHMVESNGVASISSSKFARLEKLKPFYDYVTPSFAMSGGDWFNRENDRESAIDTMKLIRQEMTELFGEKSYLVVGNHDFNYQSTQAGQYNEHMLTADEIAEAWFPEYGKTYYTFETESSRYYVFNSGIDWAHVNELTELDNEQIEWFLKGLSENDDEHIVLAPHMVVKPDTIYLVIQTYARIGTAYNARGSYEYNGKTYDFSEKTGMVEYIIGGHAHTESSGEIEGIPYVIAPTMNVNSTTPTSIFVFANYTERKLYILGMGNASDREIALLPIASEN